MKLIPTKRKKMTTLHENEYYQLNIFNNRYYRFDKILNTNMLLSRLTLNEMLTTIRNEKQQ